jgi:hypothetical protein
MELRKATPARLRSLGLDERWLQDRIEEDPALLGLGDLNVIRREKTQSTGGRIDFLMEDPDQDRELRYEVEMMLGKLDESHIIRTIEYWDVERQLKPAYDHRAVIVAEEITARFFNVIRLLNRAVPLIALQLNAFSIDGSVVLHFTKVLDVLEETDDDIEEGEQVDRRYWEKKSGSTSLAVLDKIVVLVQKELGPPRVTYNKNHIALGTTGFNFCWFHPRKSTPHCHLRLKTGSDNREAILQSLEAARVPATAFQRKLITIKMSARNLDEGHDTILDVFRQCERRSRGSED